MMFDSTISVIGMEVEMPPADEEGNIPEGSAMELHLHIGTILPLGGQPMPFLLGRLRVPMGATAAKRYGEALLEAAEQMPAEPDPKVSDLITASPGDVEQVARAAKATDKFKGKKS